MYSLEKIFKTQSSKTVSFFSKTKSQFYLNYETNLVILNKGSAIIGIDEKTEVNLVMEIIKENHFQKFGEREDGINTLQYHEKSQTLLVGGDDEKVIQYKQNGNSKKWEILRDYGDIGISWIYSFCQMGNLIFLFGSDSFRIINVHTKDLIESTHDTVIQNINSTQLCVGLNSEIYLSIGGMNADKYSEDSDLMDISYLYKKCNSLTIKSSQNKKKIKELHMLINLKIEKKRRTGAIY